MRPANRDRYDTGVRYPTSRIPDSRFALGDRPVQVRPRAELYLGSLTRKTNEKAECFIQTALREWPEWQGLFVATGAFWS
jgi:hypothetical protein